MSVLTTINMICQILAFLSAAGFFLYKLYAGYFITDLSVQLICRRRCSDNGGGNDILAVAVVLKKGEKATIRLEDIQFRVTPLDGSGAEPQIMTPEGIERLSHAPHSPSNRLRIRWELRSQSHPLLNLSAGDEVQYAAHCAVPRGSTCLVEAAVLGRYLHGKKVPQWRASEISLPPSNAGA